MVILFAFQIPGSSAVGLQSQLHTLVYAPSTSPLGFLLGSLKCFEYILLNKIQLLFILAAVYSGMIYTQESMAAYTKVTSKSLAESQAVKTKYRRQRNQEFEGRRVYLSLGAGYSIQACNLHSGNYLHKFKNSPVFSAAFGIDWHGKLRADISVFHRGDYRYTQPTSGGRRAKQKISSTAFLINGYLMPYRKSAFTPYLTAGVGVAYNKAGDFIDGKSRTDMVTGATYYDRQFGKMSNALTWQVGVGSTVAISKKAMLDLTYRYVYLGQFSNMPIATVGQQSRYGPGSGMFLNVQAMKGKSRLHEFMLGLIYKF